MSKELTSCSIELTIAAQFANILDLSRVNDALRLPAKNTLTDGTGLNKAQICYHDEITLATGNSTSLDLSGGVSHAFGAAAFTKIKAIMICNKETTAGRSITVGAGSNCLANNAIFADVSDKIRVGPGGIFLITDPSAAGIPVTNSTADILTIANACGADVTYDVVVIGEGT